jgi:hypothetical protein
VPASTRTTAGFLAKIEQFVMNKMVKAEANSKLIHLSRKNMRNPLLAWTALGMNPNVLRLVTETVAFHHLLKEIGNLRCDLQVPKFNHQDFLLKNLSCG